MTGVLIISYPGDDHAIRVKERLKYHGCDYYDYNPSLDKVTNRTFIGISNSRQKKILTRNDLFCEISPEDIRSVYFRRISSRKPVLLSEKEKNIANYILRQNTELMFYLNDFLGDAFWLPHVFQDRLLSKPKQLSLAVEVGLSIPETCFGNDACEIKKWIQLNLSSFYCVKPIDLGGSLYSPPTLSEKIKLFYLNKVPFLKKKEFYKKESLIFSKKLSFNELCEQVDDFSSIPMIYQRYIEKKLELRITVVGKKFFSVAIDSQSSSEKSIRDDWRHASSIYSSSYENFSKIHSLYELPEFLERQILQFMELSGIQFGCFDFILTKDGKYVFLEVNINGQWSWLEEILKISISDAVAQLLMKGA